MGSDEDNALVLLEADELVVAGDKKLGVARESVASTRSSSGCEAIPETVTVRGVMTAKARSSAILAACCGADRRRAK